MTPDLYELANKSRDKLAEVVWGFDTWARRIDEWTDTGLGSSPLDGSGGGSDVSRPTERRVIDDRVDDKQPQPIDEAIRNNHHRRDPTAAYRRQLEARIVKIAREIDDLHADYERDVEPRMAPPKMGDPGCELCTDVVPGHRCETAWTTSIVEKVKGREVTRKIRVCRWCGDFKVKKGRVPTMDERVAHAEGRRVRVAV
jgi:hypothetical protein